MVNDGSTDETAQIVNELGIELLNLPVNIGKGGAMNAAARQVDSDIIVFIDADLGASAMEASKIIAPVVRGEADLAVAAFPPPVKMTGLGIVRGSAAWVIRRLGGIDSIAPLSGQRAMTRELMLAVLPFNEGFGVELGMTIRALLLGYRMVEVPTQMVHRECGRDIEGVMHRTRQLWAVLATTIKEMRRRRP